MNEPHRKIRAGIAASVDDSLLHYLPAGIELVRYQFEGDETLDVDFFVSPLLSKQIVAVLPRVRARYIQTVSAGIEAVQPLLPAGSLLCNAKGVHDSSTAEWTLTAILASLKWLPFYGDLRREGCWVDGETSGRYWEQVYGRPHSAAAPILVEELRDKTVLIVGYGSIGKAIEARLLPFEPARILRLARTARRADADLRQSEVHGIAELHTLLPEADIVVLITPLTPETHHLIGPAELARMRRGAFLVNAARGGVVDTDALVAALEANQIRAALDVTDPEPLPPGHPLWRAPNLLLTPHVAGSTPQFLDRVFHFVGRQLQHLLDGEEPENIIRGTY